MGAANLKTIVVLIALPEEFDEFKRTFPSSGDVSTTYQVRLTHEVGIPDYRLISVLAEEMGSQTAASSAASAIGDLKPDLIVVLGIAGGVSLDVSVGDVCVSNEIFDVLQNSKVLDNGSGVDIRLAPDIYAVDAELVASFTFLRNHPVLSSRFEKWRSDAASLAEQMGLSNQTSELPQVHIGPIACGPVSASQSFNEKLKSLHRKLLAIETESGGVFATLARTGIPAVTIRGISDLADKDKSALEKNYRGGARQLAMANATSVFKLQLQNVRFMNVATRHHYRKTDHQEVLFKSVEAKRSIVAELSEIIKERLKQFSYDFRTRPEGFYLPVPRAQRINYVDSITGRELDDPENIVDCLGANEVLLLRLPRSFPSQALGWSLAHSLIRQQVAGKAVLPFVVHGDSIRPPSNGIGKACPLVLDPDASSECFQKVLIVEEPAFDSRSKLKFLESEMADFDGKIVILTKAEDNVSSVDAFIKEAGAVEYAISPVSFSETAFFLERAFDMDPREAEAVAIKLDDTFKRFKLDAHPTYFAGLQEETLAALINANKRAELIQLAVDGLLTLVVASDKTRPSLSRTTRERFLRRLIVSVVTAADKFTGTDLHKLARSYLEEFGFEVPEAMFLAPFFNIGILYQVEGVIRFAHPYLESYILAQALRDDPDVARDYFDPRKKVFNYYAFDLYCEMGPDKKVIEEVLSYAEYAAGRHGELSSSNHAYFELKDKFSGISKPTQLASMSKGIIARAEKLENDDRSGNVRAEKQRILDAKKHVRTGLGARRPDHHDNLPDEVRSEFDVLDTLARAFTLSVTAIGSGAESLNAERKAVIGSHVLSLASKFTDGWTRNRLRIDFADFRGEVLNEESIWAWMEEVGVAHDLYDQVRNDFELFLYAFELNFLSEPMGRVLWMICAQAGSPVLKSVIDGLKGQDKIESVIRSAWLLEVDAERGKESLKVALSDYSGTPLFRMILANHLLMRVFWHHYKRASSAHFITSAKRVLSPLGLKPPPARIEHVKRGPQGAV